jgi:hypothetical protein
MQQNGSAPLSNTYHFRARWILRMLAHIAALFFLVEGYRLVHATHQPPYFGLYLAVFVCASLYVIPLLYRLAATRVTTSPDGIQYVAHDRTIRARWGQVKGYRSSAMPTLFGKPTLLLLENPTVSFHWLYGIAHGLSLSKVFFPAFETSIPIGPTIWQNHEALGRDIRHHAPALAWPPW